MNAFQPEDYNSVQLKKFNSRTFSFVTIVFSCVATVSSFLWLFYLEGPRDGQRVPEVLGETLVSAEEHFVEYKKYNTIISLEERKGIIQKVSSHISSKDTRSLALRGYFETVRCGNGDISPLANHTEQLVDAADKYGLDWKIIPAISGVETWFGCAGAAESYHNAWGLGGGPSTRIRFDTWEEGIDTYAKMLASGYGTDVHTRLYDIASYYVYGYEGRHDRWADGVTKYFDGISGFYSAL